MGAVLTAAGEHAQAPTAAQEGLTAIVALLEQHPRGFVDLASRLGPDYIVACERAGIELDEPLLVRVARALGMEQATDK